MSFYLLFYSLLCVYSVFYELVHESLVTASCWTLRRSLATGEPEPGWFMTSPQSFLLKYFMSCATLISSRWLPLRHAEGCSQLCVHRGTSESVNFLSAKCVCHNSLKYMLSGLVLSSDWPFSSKKKKKHRKSAIKHWPKCPMSQSDSRLVSGTNLAQSGPTKTAENRKCTNTAGICYCTITICIYQWTDS